MFAFRSVNGDTDTQMIVILRNVALYFFFVIIDAIGGKTKTIGIKPRMVLFEQLYFEIICHSCLMTEILKVIIMTIQVLYFQRARFMQILQNCINLERLSSMCKIFAYDINGIAYLEDIGVCRRIILKWILKKPHVNVEYSLLVLNKVQWLAV